MTAAEQFAENDRLDRLRMWAVFNGIAGAALGVDPGPSGVAEPLTNPVGQYQVFNVTTGTAPQGGAATVTTTVAGKSFTLPMIVAVVGAAWLLFRR